MIAVLVIHGMGDQKDDFSEFFNEGIAHFYNSRGGNEKELSIEKIYWADVLAAEEKEIIKRTAGETLSFRNYLRPFVVNYLADVIAYQKTFERKELEKKQNDEYGDRGIYYLIQERISNGIGKLKTSYGEGVPIIMVGHSLGSVMLLNYIHDMQKSEDDKIKRRWDYEDKFNLVGLITMGSPLALWLLRFNEFGRSIKFPLETTEEKFKDSAKWYNFFDPEDILAYPLKNLNKTYSELAPLTDIKIEVGTAISGMTPLSHNGYFKSTEIMEFIADYILKIQKKIK